jgi:hypothetical protein
VFCFLHNKTMLLKLGVFVSIFKLTIFKITLVFLCRFQVSLTPTNSLLVEISPELRNTMQDYVSSFNKWSLTGNAH